jgi:DNA-binding NarL/FixJ family response regulator
MGAAESKRQIRVLIVDDHPVFREGLRHILESEPGIEVVAEADTGELGLREARRHRPDVVILDVNMPALDGLQAARRLREELPGIAVIVLTAYHDEQQMIRALRSGAAAYYAKDVPPGELLAAVQEVASGRCILQGRSLSREQLGRWLARRAFAEEGGLSLAEEFGTPLTEREMEVLRCVAVGMSNKEVASRLGISEQTVKNHMTAILRKLGVSDRTQAAIYAVRHGWVHLQDLPLG